MKAMKSLTFALVLALGSVACSGTATNVPGVTAQAAATKAPLNVQVQGPLRGIADSFAEIPLRPDQRTAIEDELTKAEARHATLRPMGKEIALLVADQIEKGAIDDAVLQPKIQAAVAAFGPVRDADRQAIQRTHDLLDADQRVAIIDALDAKHHDRMAKHDGPPGGRHGMHDVAEQLELTQDQKGKIFEAVKNEWLADGPEHAFKEGVGEKIEAKQRRDKAREAFKSDTFKIDEAAPKFDLEKGGQKMLEHGLRVAKVVLPMLTPEQRTKAAALIRDRAENFGELH